MDNKQSNFSEIIMKSKISNFGFLGKPFNFKDSSLNCSNTDANKFLSVDSIYLLDQTHSNHIVNVSDRLNGDCQADGIWLNKNQYPELINKAIGIRTADCLPIFIQTTSKIILLHAGWRGVADGIIENSIDIIKDDLIEKLFIGPSACSDCYEVQKDCLSKFQFSINKTIGDKFFLDLSTTALEIFKSKCNFKSEAVLSQSQICTITDLSWHSYRREKESRGSNLLYFSIT